jgi:hypothetical protein
VILLLGLLLGAAAGRALTTLLQPALSAPLFARTNHRGATVPTAAGLVVALSALAVEPRSRSPTPPASPTCRSRARSGS